MDCGRGTMCPMNQNCVNNRCEETCRDPMCGPATSVACGMRERLCNGTMCDVVGTMCPPNQNCDNGVCVCVPGFDLTPEMVDCADRIPNRCLGQPPSDQYGTRCPNAGRCDATTHTCIACTSMCQKNARCGDSNGCNDTCEGTCDPGFQCIRDPMDMNRHRCLSNTCNPACNCGQVCTNGTCVNLCGAGTRLCGCSSCCRESQSCLPGGVCRDGPG